MPWGMVEGFSLTMALCVPWLNNVQAELLVSGWKSLYTPTQIVPVEHSANMCTLSSLLGT